MSIIDTLSRTLSELEQERATLDADIEDLSRVIARHADTASRDPRTRRNGRSAPPGEGRQQLLALLAKGGEWSPSMIAKERGTSTNAARAMLKRIAAEDPSPIERSENGYRLLKQSGRRGS